MKQEEVKKRLREIEEEAKAESRSEGDPRKVCYPFAFGYFVGASTKFVLNNLCDNEE